MCPDGAVALTFGEHQEVYRAIVSADGTSVELQSLAGQMYDEYGQDEARCRDGPGKQARFCDPAGLAALRDGTLVVCDTANTRIRLVSPGGVVSTLAGVGTAAGRQTDGAYSWSPPVTDWPWGVAVRRDGTVVFTQEGHSVRAIAHITTAVTALAGQHGQGGHVDGDAAAARFHGPRGVAVLPDGRTLVCDVLNHRLRLISADGCKVSTLAGSGAKKCVDGVGVAAAVQAPCAVAVDCAGTVVVGGKKRWGAYGPDGGAAIYVGLRLVNTASGTVTTLRNANGDPLTLNGTPHIAIDARGRLLVADDKGLHIIAGLELAPGFFPQWTNLEWRPNRERHTLLTPSGKAAVRMILLVAAKTQLLPSLELRTSALQLPIELWHHVLARVLLHDIGAVG